jgi:hypothetical protein
MVFQETCAQKGTAGTAAITSTAASARPTPRAACLASARRRLRAARAACHATNSTSPIGTARQGSWPGFRPLGNRRRRGRLGIDEQGNIAVRSPANFELQFLAPRPLVQNLWRWRLLGRPQPVHRRGHLGEHPCTATTSSKHARDSTTTGQGSSSSSSSNSSSSSSVFACASSRCSPCGLRT